MMSEKRFFSSVADEKHTLIQERGNLRATYLRYREVVDLLNDLSEENKELKQQLNKIPENIRKVWLE